ncbi:hypothetical protein [Robertkochia solimangrovi]|uniref:hypothetical protein n=1 Tax=Robertkochia solimangrovi TaxID=2213046 RepID=UPI00117E420E|nr:hypothetical protein [Robertkochia solimangrovi]TRZ46489.1 hypothetical protein DMZ48_03555 [Robertkochia solimangrovi]
MKASKTYLKGKSVFNVSLIVIGITILTVYLTGINIQRSLTSNSYFSLGIIATALFFFMSYGLYTGIGLIDDYPSFQNLKKGFITGDAIPDVKLPEVSIGEGIGGLVLSILVWIGISMLIIVLMIVLEAALWFSIFILLAILYWIFFRALKMVFIRSKTTQGNIVKSTMYALGYTLLYTGWIFALIYITAQF